MLPDCTYKYTQPPPSTKSLFNGAPTAILVPSFDTAIVDPKSSVMLNGSNICEYSKLALFSL